jgi:sulfotransferase
MSVIETHCNARLVKVHFRSGLPRSGSTLLAALLRQNPRFYAAMTSPVGGLVDRMLEAISEDNEFSTFISLEQKRVLILSIFSAYYHPQSPEELQELMESILIAGLN